MSRRNGELEKPQGIFRKLDAQRTQAIWDEIRRDLADPFRKRDDYAASATARGCADDFCS